MTAEFPQTAIIVPSRSMSLSFRSLLSSAKSHSFPDMFPHTLPLKGKERYLADSISCWVTPPIAVVGPLLGAPSAEIVLKILFSRGVRRVIFCGSAAWLTAAVKGSENCDRDEPSFGEIVLPQRIFPFDAISRAYMHESDPSDPSRSLSNDAHCGYVELSAAPLQIELASHLRKHLQPDSSGILPGVFPRVFDGNSCSVDSPYREHLLAPQCLSLGIGAIDMESASVAAICQRQAAAFGVVLYVSDILRVTDGNCSQERGFSTPQYLQTSKVIAPLILSYALSSPIVQFHN